MAATTTTDGAHLDAPTQRRGAFRGLRERAAAFVSSVVAAVLGIAPHVLHHAGPLAGAALLSGTGGTVLFGVIGLVAAVPFLLRVHRRTEGWRIPGALLALFAVLFSISTFVVGPAITGDGGDSATPATDPAVPGAPAGENVDPHHR